MSIWLVILLNIFIFTGETLGTGTAQEFIDYYKRQICLNKQFLNYYKSMVQAYAEESANRKIIIPGIKYVQPTNLQLLATLNERFVSLQFNVIAWACYFHYKEAHRRPLIDRAEKCKNFLNFLSWYNDALAVIYIYRKSEKPQFMDRKKENYVYTTEDIFKEMDRQLLQLKHMNEALLLHENDDLEIFFKLRPHTNYYLSEYDVMPIKELLSKNKYEDNNKAADTSVLKSIFNRNTPPSSPLAEYHDDRAYLKDYHDEIYRRLYLYFGSGLLQVKHYLNDFLKTTSVPYLEAVKPPLRLSEQFWEFIIKIQSQFDKLDYASFESAISLHSELFKIWLSSYNRIPVPEDADTLDCYLSEQDDYVNSKLEFYNR